LGRSSDAVLRRHRALQAAERIKAGQLGTDGGWLFATPTGQPVNMTGAAQRDVADRLGLLLWGNETAEGAAGGN
jgi:hypothetical protein